MLEAIGIRKTFYAGTANEVRALQGIDLAIEAGAFVIVIGTNGSGKSTFLDAASGRARHHDLAGASSGEVHRPGFPESLQRHGAEHDHRRESCPGSTARPSAHPALVAGMLPATRNSARGSNASTWGWRIGWTIRSATSREASARR